jgi:EpsI family protein
MNQNLRFSATVLAMSATLGVIRFARDRDQPALGFPISSIDRQVKGWTATDDTPPSAYILKSLGATSFLSRTYRRGAVDMNLWIAYYANQQAGETMHSPKYCLPGTGWELIAQDAARIPVGDESVAVNDYLMIRPGEQMGMLYWYQSRKRVVASEYAGKLALMWDAIRYGQTSGSIVRITLPEGNAHRAEGLAFAGEIIRQLARCYGE